MARIRNLKPDFFTDAEMLALSPLHRLLFQGLWCHADREGRLEDRPKDLKVRILPSDACDVDSMLADLERAGRLIRYSVADQRLLEVTNFRKHQRCHKDEKPSVLPGPQRVMAKPPQPFEAGVEVLRSAGKNPQSTASPPLPAGNFDALRPETETGAGDGDGCWNPEPPPRQSAPVGALRDGIERLFREARGAEFTWANGGERAIQPLLRHGTAEVLRRWEIALGTNYPGCSSIRELVTNWDAYAKSKPTGPPGRDARRGVARAEDADHSKNKVLDDGTIEF